MEVKPRGSVGEMHKVRQQGAKQGTVPLQQRAEKGEWKQKHCGTESV